MLKRFLVQLLKKWVVSLEAKLDKYEFLERYIEINIGSSAEVF